MAPNQRHHKHPEGGPAQERDAFGVHRQMVLWLFFATAGLVIFTIAILLITNSTPAGGAAKPDAQIGVTILPMVALAGALGAFVSALSRLYAFKNIFPYAKYTGVLKGVSLYLIIYSTIPPLVGAIAATVLYIIFAAGLVTSPVFPDFHCTATSGLCDQFNTFLQSWSPKTSTDYAKALVWGFIAGFSERFVPDILNRLADRADKEGTHGHDAALR